MECNMGGHLCRQSISVDAVIESALDLLEELKM